jgi:hypothetical protein
MYHQRFLVPAVWGLILCGSLAPAAEPIELGSQRELFVDDYLIGRLSGEARQVLQKPVPQEVVLVTDKPWEGNTCAYYTIFQDGDRYRMYYRGSHYDTQTRKSAHAEVVCYAESRDGIQWTKPELGLCEFAGSKANNIVWNGPGGHNFTPFKDANPACPTEARYKALAGGGGGSKPGLYAFQSADGLHWSLIRNEPVITKGAFDSQNLAFWDPHAKLYREFHRHFRGVRDIMGGTSSDFLSWTAPAFLEYPGAPKEHLYTNAIQTYSRAPHLLIGFPTRFHPERGDQVEPVFMSSRDGCTFHRWPEALIPVTAPENRDGNRSNYMTWGLVQLPGNDKEYSVYATEAYYTGPDSRVRRFTYRVDGFVSVHASAVGGQLVTKPLRFAGMKLTINAATAGEGRIRVEIQDATGQAIEGFALADCQPFRGDAIEHTVTWTGGSNVGSLAGKPVQLRFEVQDANLYALQFTD